MWHSLPSFLHSFPFWFIVNLLFFNNIGNAMSNGICGVLKFQDRMKSYIRPVFGWLGDKSWLTSRGISKIKHTEELDNDFFCFNILWLKFSYIKWTQCFIYSFDFSLSFLFLFSSDFYFSFLFHSLSYSGLLIQTHTHKHISLFK